MTDITSPEQVQAFLEDAIDRYGLTVVCDMLGGVCDAKARHLETTCQDARAAKPWHEAGRKFHALEVSVRDLEILRADPRRLRRGRL